MTDELKGNLETLCIHCEKENVILVWKNYLKQYRGICPNKECQVCNGGKKMIDEKELILELDKFVKKGILKKVLDNGEWKYVKN
jgi:hypothetical protein